MTPIIQNSRNTNIYSDRKLTSAWLGGGAGMEERVDKGT